MNPVAQTTTVTYDPTLISLVELRDCIQRCGYECRGQSAPEHLCDPMAEPDPSDLATATVSAPAASEEHESARHAHAEETLRSPEERMGHGGHAGMSMDAMVTNTRRRFLVAAAEPTARPHFVNLSCPASADRPRWPAGESTWR